MGSCLTFSNEFLYHHSRLCWKILVTALFTYLHSRNRLWFAVSSLQLWRWICIENFCWILLLTSLMLYFFSGYKFIWLVYHICQLKYYTSVSIFPMFVICILQHDFRFGLQISNILVCFSRRSLDAFKIDRVK